MEQIFQIVYVSGDNGTEALGYIKSKYPWIPINEEKIIINATGNGLQLLTDLKELTKRFPSVTIITERILDTPGFIAMRRYRNGETEVIQQQLKLPPFKNIRERAQNKMSISERIGQMIQELEEIKSSGYIPFASPCPSSSEKAVKINFNSALRELKKFKHGHDALYGQNKQKEKIEDQIYGALIGKHIDNAADILGRFGKVSFVDEKIDDASEGEDTYVMMRSFDVGILYVKIYYGNNTREIGSIEVDEN